MTSAEITDRIYDIILEMNNIELSDIDNKTLEELNLDSIQIFTLYVKIEDCFEVLLEPQNFNKSTKISEIANEIYSKKSGKH